MDVKIHSAVDIDAKFKEYIEEKFGRLSKFIFDKGQTEIYIRKEGPLFLTEIKVVVKNSTIFIKEEDNDINKSIEVLYDRAKSQLRKLHDKITDKPHN